MCLFGEIVNLISRAVTYFYIVSEKRNAYTVIYNYAAQVFLDKTSFAVLSYQALHFIKLKLD